MRISFIIITMNRLALLKRAIQSIDKQVYQDKEIIVVDNGSSDGTAEALAKECPHVRVIQPGKNLGVAGGRNLGVASASGKLCVFLDDDATFTSTDVCERVMAHFKSDPQLIGLSFRIILKSTMQTQHSSIPRHDKADQQSDYPCAYFCGAGFALRRQPFVDLGSFWERLFYAGEELEFGYRAVSSGSHFLYSTDICVIHEATLVSRPSFQRIFYYTRNRPLIALRHLPMTYVLSHTVAWGLYGLASALRTGQLKAFLAAFGSMMKLVPEVWSIRAPLNAEKLSRLKQLHGRLLY